MVDIINNDIIDVAILNNSLFTSLLKWDENWFILNIRKQINDDAIISVLLIKLNSKPQINLIIKKGIILKKSIKNWI